MINHNKSEIQKVIIDAKISKILFMSNNPTYPKIKAQNTKQYLVKIPS